jgi:hypothetical protein
MKGKSDASKVKAKRERLQGDSIAVGAGTRRGEDPTITTLEPIDALEPRNAEEPTRSDRAGSSLSDLLRLSVRISYAVSVLRACTRRQDVAP